MSADFETNGSEIMVQTNDEISVRMPKTPEPNEGNVLSDAVCANQVLPSTSSDEVPISRKGK